MTPEDACYGAAKHLPELLRNGITTVQVMPSITVVEDAEVAAAVDAGIRARLIPHIVDREKVEATVARIEAAAAARADGVRTWLGVEVPQIVAPPTLRLLAEEAERLGVNVHTHFAETEPGDLAQLADAGLLRTGLTSPTACTWTTARSRRWPPSGRASPTTSRTTRATATASRRCGGLLDTGVVVGLDTDGPDWTFSCYIFEEARLAAFLTRATAQDPPALTGDEALRLATGGAFGRSASTARSAGSRPGRGRA